ncbi:hypothetical protein ACHAWF_019045 [Thalassiosira exigua]
MKLSLFMTLVTLAMALVAAQPPPKGKQDRTPGQPSRPKGRQPKDQRNSQKGKDPRNTSQSDDGPKGKWPRDRSKGENKNHRDSGDTSKSKGKDDRPGGSYCTHAPDYKCYKSGWPRCCNGPKGSRSCPRRRPSCDRSPKNPSSKSTRSPTKSSTDTTRRSSKASRRRCIPNDSPRTRRRGQRYRFELVRSNAKCVDAGNETYEYGQFNRIHTFSDCTKACVRNVRSSLLDSGGFRGVDFDCRSSECRCLYDEGTLDRRNSRRFDRTNRNEQGYGPIDGTKRTRSSRGTYCGKLVGSDFLEADELLNTDVTELWGVNDQD